MRTVIYVGLLSIADAINKNWLSEKHLYFYAIILIAAILFDMIEISNISNSKNKK